MSLRFKRHHKLVVFLALLSAVLVLGMGDQGIVAYAVPAGTPVVAQAASIAALLIP